jgi:hypothetical protein
MFADTFLAAERLHVVSLLAWGAISVIVGTGLLFLTSAKRIRPDLLRSFAAQCAMWGALEIAVGSARYVMLEMRDLSGASRVERLGWIQVGLYIGMAASGIAIAATGWRTARSLRTAGAGLGVFLQGTALLVIELYFVAQISR